MTIIFPSANSIFVVLLIKIARFCIYLQRKCVKQMNSSVRRTASHTIKMCVWSHTCYIVGVEPLVYKTSKLLKHV